MTDHKIISSCSMCDGRYEVQTRVYNEVELVTDI
jgi:hypothetical protein